MSNRPLVTVVIPARNEEPDIGRCLEAVLRQDYPLDRLEVLVVDGGSVDRTAEIAKDLLVGRDLSRFEIISNPIGATPSNLNVGLGQAAGDYLCRVDARSIVPPHYVRTCVEVLGARPDVAVTGGRQVALARDGSQVAVGIARALNNRFGMGMSRYRRGGRSGESDTVYLGAFRVEQLRAAGGWDERLVVNQDFDLNRRMARFGRIWFEAGLDVGYLPRRDLSSLWRQYQRFGQGKVRYWRLTGRRMQGRQAVLLAAPPVALVAGLLVLLGAGRRRCSVLAAAVAIAALVEARGVSEPRGTPAARAVSVVASGIVGAGWWTGVVRGWASERRRAS
jgi:succinoglycan biosynthesis protein ExoA